MYCDDLKHAHHTGFDIDLDLGELASGLVIAKALVVRHALALSRNRIAGDPPANLSHRDRARGLEADANRGVARLEIAGLRSKHRRRNPKKLLLEMRGCLADGG